MEKRFKIISAVYLLLVKGGKILLSRRYNTGFHDGEYSFPAGHLDGGETLKQALIREAHEEVGINLEPRNCKLVHVMHRKGADEERFNFFFTAENWEGDLKIMEPDKCDDLNWFSLNQLPVNLIPYIREVIENYLKGSPYSEFGWI